MVDFSCILSGILFTAGNVCMIAYLAKEGGRAHFDRGEYNSFKTSYIKQEWDFRTEASGLWLTAGILNAFAWLVFTIPILKLSWILSHGGKDSVAIHIAIAILVVGGSMGEFISRCFWFGYSMASKKLLEFNLDNWLRTDLANDLAAAGDGDTSDGLGWKTLELNHIVGTGFLWFVDAFEWICLSGIMVCVYISVRHWRAKDVTCFGGCWNGLTLFIGGLCLLEFTSEVLRFEGFKVFGFIALLYGAVNRLILIPYWILALGYGLDRATIKQAYGPDGITSELALTEVRQAPPTFTIDDDGEPMDDGGTLTADAASPAGLDNVALDRVPPEGSFANFK